MDLSGLSALANIGQAVTDRRSIADNFDTFLQLLTTQLQNQNPLDPLDTNEFTNQLVQFSSVEQAIKTNENLEVMVRLALANTATNAVGYIGKTIEAEGTVARLSNGSASWKYTAAQSAPDSTISIRNSSGSVVYSVQQSLNAGTNTFTWDGRDASGNTLPDDDYQISINAKDSQGQSVSVKTAVGGIVDSVDLSGDEPVLIIGSTRISLSSVKYIGSQ